MEKKNYVLEENQDNILKHVVGWKTSRRKGGSRPWVGLNHHPFGLQPNALTNCATETAQSCGEAQGFNVRPTGRQEVGRLSRAPLCRELTASLQDANARLAQSVEHETLNIRVVRARPRWGAVFSHSPWSESRLCQGRYSPPNSTRSCLMKRNPYTAQATGECGHRSRYLSHAKRALHHLSLLPLTEDQGPAL